MLMPLLKVFGRLEFGDWVDDVRVGRNGLGRLNLFTLCQLSGVGFCFFFAFIYIIHV